MFILNCSFSDSPIMMLLFEQNFAAFTMLWCCRLLNVKGDAACPRNFTGRNNVITALQSEVLLPCYFDSVFITSIQKESTGVVWSHINRTADLVEIKLNDYPGFWDSRNGRIKVFSYVSGSGNFSILIHNVSKSDLGLYRCELFKETNCPLHYKEINISLVSPINIWLLIIGGGGGGFLLLCLITACGCYTWTNKHRVKETEEITYASIVHKSRQDRDVDHVVDKKISETVLYASINKGGGRR